MAKILADQQARSRRGDARPVARRRLPWGRWALALNALFAYTFLYAPIVVLIALSFNIAKFGTEWQGWTWQWYESLFSNDRLRDAALTSVQIAFTSTVIATIIGTMAALALARQGWAGRRTLDGAIYLPVIIPDIVMAVSLLGFFTLSFQQLRSWLGLDVEMGLLTVIIAHVAFNISFVTVVVRASLAHFDQRLEEAAADLGANSWQTFRRIKLPLILPGIISGSLLAFTLSLDDFVVTFFARGPGVNTLTTEVYGRIRRYVSPEINAISTVMLLASSALVIASLVLQRRGQRAPTR